MWRILTLGYQVTGPEFEYGTSRLRIKSDSFCTKLLEDSKVVITSDLFRLQDNKPDMHKYKETNSNAWRPVGNAYTSWGEII